MRMRARARVCVCVCVCVDNNLFCVRLDKSDYRSFSAFQMGFPGMHSRVRKLINDVIACIVHFCVIVVPLIYFLKNE